MPSGCSPWPEGRAQPRLVAALCLTAALLVLVSVISAQPSRLDAIQRLAITYHEDPARLDDARADLERKVAMDADPTTLVILARISYIWGDVRAGTRAEKLRAYERGQQVATRALEIAPQNTDARYWYAVNTGRWAETKGVFSALAQLSTIKTEIQAVLDADPRYTDAYGFAGSLYEKLPSLLGGDMERAERMFRQGLTLDPTSTGQRVGLARVLMSRGRADEARKELQRVLDEATPRNPAEWTLRDSKEARTLLEKLPPPTR